MNPRIESYLKESKIEKGKFDGNNSMQMLSDSSNLQKLDLVHNAKDGTKENNDILNSSVISTLLAALHEKDRELLKIKKSALIVAPDQAITLHNQNLEYGYTKTTLIQRKRIRLLSRRKKLLLKRVFTLQKALERKNEDTLKKLESYQSVLKKSYEESLLRGIQGLGKSLGARVTADSGIIALNFTNVTLKLEGKDPINIEQQIRQQLLDVPGLNVFHEESTQYLFARLLKIEAFSSSK